MIGDGVQIIDRVLVILVAGELREIQARQGEVDKRGDLVAVHACVAEALEVDDKHVRQLPHVHHLGGTLVLLAVGAIPRIVLAQDLLFGKGAQTLR